MSTVINVLRSFSGHGRTFPYVVVREVRRRFLCKHKIFRHSPTRCQYAEGSFTKRNANDLCVTRTLLNAIRTVCSSAIRQRFVCSVVVFVQPNLSLLKASRSPKLFD